MPVLFFGRLAGLAASDPDAPVDAATFRARVSKQYPDVADASVRMAVNQRLVDDDALIAPGDEIAFLPPMSGG